MEKSKATKKSSDNALKTPLKENLPDMKARIPWRYTYFAGSINGRSKEKIKNAGLRLRHYQTFIVSKKTRFEDSRLQKIRRTLLHGSFKLLLKRFRTVNLSNDFIDQICTFIFFSSNVAVMESEGFEYLKENSPLLQSEILKTVAGCDEGHGSGGKSQSVWAQFSDGCACDTNEVERSPDLWAQLSDGANNNNWSPGQEAS